MSTLAANRIFSRQSLARRVMRRIERRRAPTGLPFLLEHKTVFVVPTAFGFGFGMMLVFMLIGGLNFNNNMALLLVFLLGVIAQMTTMMAYRNLRGLIVEDIRCEPVFAGEPAHFRIFVSNPESTKRFALMAGATANPVEDCVDMEARSTATLELKVPTVRRGWHKLPAFRLETRYPLGLFRAWSWVFAEARCLVYPAPARNAPPLPRTGRGRHGKAEKGEGEQVHGLRNYRVGDPLRRVAWRTSARHGALFTREMETPRESSCALDWNLLAGVGAEQRLAILTSWVLQADHRQLSYSLNLPNALIEVGSGPEHRAACLEALALHGL